MSFTFLYHLSSRELQILECISTGETINEIARKLYLSPHTIITHRRNLLKKLNAKNGADMIRVAFQEGFLMLEPKAKINNLKQAS